MNVRDESEKLNHAEIRAVAAEERAAEAERRAAEAEVRAMKSESARFMSYLSIIPGDDTSWFHTWNHNHRVFIQSESAAHLAGKSNANRKGVPSDGLPAFSARCHSAVISSAQGDPFADHLLVRVESDLDVLVGRLQTEYSTLRDLPANQVILTDSSGAARPPLSLTFRLGTHGAKALHCLLQYDNLVHLASTLREYGCIKCEKYDGIVFCFERKFRLLYSIAYGFASWGCTREDLAKENMVARISALHHIWTGLIDFNTPEDVFHAFRNYDARPTLGSDGKQKTFVGQAVGAYVK